MDFPSAGRPKSSKTYSHEHHPNPPFGVHVREFAALFRGRRSLVLPIQNMPLNFLRLSPVISTRQVGLNPFIPHAKLMSGSSRNPTKAASCQHQETLVSAFVGGTANRSLRPVGQESRDQIQLSVL